MAEIEYSGRDNLDVMLDARNYNRFLLGLITGAAEKGNAIVDFGAGSGTFCMPMVSAGYQVACVETDPVLSRKLSDQGLQVWEDLARAADGGIDYVYSLNVLEHIKEDEAVIALWYRKLRPGGKLLVYVPAFQSLFSSMDRKVGHFRRYQKDNLSEKLRRAGFVVVTTRYADSVGFFATLVYKLVGSDKGDIDPKMLRIYDRWIFPVSKGLDRLVGRLFGKNVYSLAVKPDRLG